VDELYGDMLTADNNPGQAEAGQSNEGLPSYCAKNATKNEVRAKIERYANLIFPGMPFPKAVTFLTSCVAAARGQSVEIPLRHDENDRPTIRICPYCLDVLDCGPGLHFRARGRPVSILWVGDGDLFEHGPSWIHARGEVNRLAASFRVIRDFVERFESSPLAAALKEYRERQVSRLFQTVY
jgi:hypothetical protein